MEPARGFPHFQPLQKMCMRTLKELLRMDFSTFGPICMEKAFFSQPRGDRVTLAKHYFVALSDEVDAFALLWRTCDDEKAKNLLLARLFHVLLLHLGVEDNEPHRVLAFQRLKRLLGNPVLVPHCNFLLDALRQQHGCSSSAAKMLPVLCTEVVTRMQLTVSSLLASAFEDIALIMATPLLRFLSTCGDTQQRKLCAVTQPWLAEVSLQPEVNDHHIRSTTNSHGEDNGEISEQLLSTLFRLTTNISNSCSAQLEHAWITLALASADKATQSHGASYPNLPRVMNFVFRQRASSHHVATAKTVVWWLRRPHSDAAFEVVFTPMDCVHSRRTSCFSSVTNHLEASMAQVVYPLNDIAVVLTLLSDSCCHLTPRHHEPAFMETTVQIVAFALLILYSMAQDHGSSRPSHVFSQCKREESDYVGERTATTRYFEAAHARLAEDIARECTLVLRTLLPLMHPSPSSVEVENVLDALSKFGLPRNHAAISDFNSILAEYVKCCMPPSETTIWSDECVKEFLLAIALYNSGSSKAAMPVEPAKLQSTLCLRFSVLMYLLLAPPFHGDVFLSLMELLHHSLDERNRDPVNTNALVRDCLVTLCAMVEIMPVAKLVLYPQIVWDQVVDLLLTIVSKPHFLAQSILHDVLLAKRPPHWSKSQSSVLRAIALNMHSSGDPRLYERAQRIVVQAVALSCPVFVADALERLATCTFALAPIIGSTNNDLEHLQSIALDLSYLWRGENRELGSEISELLKQFSRAESDSSFLTAGDSNTDALVGNNTSVHEINRHGFLSSFASRFVQLTQFVANDELSFDPLSTSFEILVSTSESGCRSKHSVTENNGGEWEPHAEASVALFVMERLLQEIEILHISWTPSPTVLASFARSARSAPDKSHWEATVRIMSYISAPVDSSTPRICTNMTPSSSSSSIVKDKPLLTIMTLPTDASSSAPGSSGGHGSSISPKTTPKASVSTPTSVKKDSLQSAKTKLMNLVTRRASSSPRSNNNSNNANSSSSNISHHHVGNNNDSSSCASSTTSIVGSNPAAESHDTSNSLSSHKAVTAAPCIDPSEACAVSTLSRSKLFRS